MSGIECHNTVTHSRASDLEIAHGATLTPLAEVGAAMSPAATRIDIDSRGEIVGLS